MLDTKIVRGKTTSKKCRPTLGRVEVCNYKYGKVSWLGKAQVWINGSHITKATIKMNDSYLGSPPYNTAAWRNSVMCQEIGHIFGLDHQDETHTNPNLGSCMDYTNNPAGPLSNEHPNQHDYDALVSRYAHLNSSTTVGQATPPPAMNLLTYNKRTEWGRKERQSVDGKLEWHELDFGGGHKVLTFVILAP